MDYISESAVSILLPILILVWTIAIKVIVNHNRSIAGLMEEILKLPGDISILATSFATSGILLVSKENNSLGVMNFVVLLFVSFLLTLIIFASCKKLVELNDKGTSRNWQDWVVGVIIFLLTYTTSGITLYVAILFILTGVN